MKKLLFLIVSISFCFSLYAQDTIRMDNGDTKEGIVVKVSKHNIVYKINENDNKYIRMPLDSVLYIKYQSGEQIFYEHGTELEPKSVFSNLFTDTTKSAAIDKQISSYDVQPLTTTQAIYSDYYHKKMLFHKVNQRTFKTLGLIYGITTGAAISIAVIASATNGLTVILGLGAGALGAIVDYWLPFGILSANSRRKANIYSANLFDMNFNLGELQMTTGINVMHDNVMNQNGLGVGLTINL